MFASPAPNGKFRATDRPPSGGRRDPGHMQAGTAMFSSQVGVGALTENGEKVFAGFYLGPTDNAHRARAILEDA
jgi:hypothetical protein